MHGSVDAAHTGGASTWPQASDATHKGRDVMWLGKAWEGALTQGAAGVGGDAARGNGRDSSKQRQNKKKKKKNSQAVAGTSTQL